MQKSVKHKKIGLTVIAMMTCVVPNSERIAKYTHAVRNPEISMTPNTNSVSLHRSV